MAQGWHGPAEAAADMDGNGAHHGSDSGWGHFPSSTHARRHRQSGSTRFRPESTPNRPRQLSWEPACWVCQVWRACLMRWFSA